MKPDYNISNYFHVRWSRSVVELVRIDPWCKMLVCSLNVQDNDFILSVSIFSSLLFSLCLYNLIVLLEVNVMINVIDFISGPFWLAMCICDPCK